MRVSGVPKEWFRSVETRKVIYLVTLVGEGVEGDPVREYHRAIDPETGVVLCERDTWRESGDE